jgi:protein-S-isoprenylcysteine O-methyltransferase Ste14
MRRVFGIIVGTTVGAVVLFAVAGTAAWWNAWAFLVFMVVLGELTSRLIKNTPGLAEERRTAAERAKPWDLTLVRLINLTLPVMLIVSAFEIRFQWFPSIPAAVSVGAFAAMIPAAMLTYRAIAANVFFSSHVRIQEDRGQTVVSTGPYGVVRHPGYAGSAAFNLLVPLALGSWAALLPAFGTVALLAYRTIKEDRVLLEELPGYAAYAKQVRDRLIPKVW